MIAWARISQPLKRHLDRFNCFCRAHERDRQTDHATPSVAVARILCTECTLCGLKLNIGIKLTIKQLFPLKNTKVYQLAPFLV